jgi:hypothetical protein
MRTTDDGKVSASGKELLRLCEAAVHEGRDSLRRSAVRQ